MKLEQLPIAWLIALLLLIGIEALHVKESWLFALFD